MGLVVLKMHELGTVFNDDFVKVLQTLYFRDHIHSFLACMPN